MEMGNAPPLSRGGLMLRKEYPMHGDLGRAEVDRGDAHAAELALAG